MSSLNRPIPEEPSVISCSVCLTEIPGSVANSQEADEYTQHYCGLECYLQWKDRHSEKS